MTGNKHSKINVMKKQKNIKSNEIIKSSKSLRTVPINRESNDKQLRGDDTNIDRSNEKVKFKKNKQLKSIKGNTDIKDNSKRIKSKQHK